MFASLQLQQSEFSHIKWRSDTFTVFGAETFTLCVSVELQLEVEKHTEGLCSSSSSSSSNSSSSNSSSSSSSIISSSISSSSSINSSNSSSKSTWNEMRLSNIKY